MLGNTYIGKRIDTIRLSYHAVDMQALFVLLLGIKQQESANKE